MVQSTTSVEGTYSVLGPVVQFIVVEVTEEVTQSTSSILTVQSSVEKLVPVIVIAVPPLVGPSLGSILVIVGVASLLYSTTSVSLITLSFWVI